MGGGSIGGGAGGGGGSGGGTMDAGGGGEDAGVGDGGDDSGTPDGGNDAGPADWQVTLDLDAGGARLAPEQSGAYELSGAIYQYDQVPGLVTQMQALGFKYWRVGLGRWEIGSEEFASVPATDGGTLNCPAPVLAFQTSTHASLDELVAYRDFFKLNVDHAPAGLDVNDMDDPANYDFTYVDTVVAEAEAFGAEPYLDIDYVPKALSSVQTYGVADCTNTFANGVTTAPPVDDGLYARAVVHVLVHLLDGWPNGSTKHVLHYVEIGNEPENVPYFWSGTEQQFDVWFASVAALVGAYRDSVKATDAAWAGLKVGGGSFAEAPGGRNWLPHLLDVLDNASAPVPLDFLSMHSYHDIPQAVVGDEVGTVTELFASRHAGRYFGTELVLAEWGPGLNELSNASFNQSIQAPLVYGAGLAGAEATGYAFTQKALFYDFAHLANGAGMTYGLIDWQGQPEPAYHAFALFQQLVADTPLRLSFPAVFPANGFDGIAVGGVNAAGTQVQLYVVNLIASDRVLQIDGTAMTQATLQVLDGTGAAVRTVGPMSPSRVTVPKQSVTLIQLEQ